VNKSVFSLLPRLLTRHCSHLLVSAVMRRCCAARPAHAAVSRYLPPARRSAANPPHAATAVEWWDRHTDGRTDNRPCHRPCPALYAPSVNKAVIDRRLRSRCCHPGSYFKRPKCSPVRTLACNWYYCAQFIAKPKALCALRFSWAATSSNLGLWANNVVIHKTGIS